MDQLSPELPLTSSCSIQETFSFDSDSIPDEATEQWVSILSCWHSSVVPFAKRHPGIDEYIKIRISEIFRHATLPKYLSEEERSPENMQIVILQKTGDLGIKTSNYPEGHTYLCFNRKYGEMCDINEKFSYTGMEIDNVPYEADLDRETRALVTVVFYFAMNGQIESNCGGRIDKDIFMYAKRLANQWAGVTALVEPRVAGVMD